MNKNNKNSSNGNSGPVTEKNIDISNCGFPERAQRFREAMKLSPKSLAFQVGVDVRTITDIERGRRPRITPHTLMGLAQALDRSVDELLGRSPEEASAVEHRSRAFRIPLAIMMILGGLFLLAAILIGQALRTASFEVTDSRLHVEMLGIGLWETPVDIKVRSAAETPWSRLQGHPLVFFEAHSSLGDGALFIRERISGTLLLKDHISQQELGEVFGPKMTELGSMYCVDLKFVDMLGDGTSLLLAIFHHENYYPACFRIYDRHGNTKGSYFHPGYYYSTIITDLDEDGREEILIAGTNNSYKGATLLVLDAEHCNGAAIDSVASKAFNKSFPDSAHFRFVLPGFSDNEMTQLEIKRFHAIDPVVFRSSEGNIRIRVKIGPPLGVQDAYHLILDQDLRPLRLYASDAFRGIASRHLNEGTLDFDPTSEEFIDAWLGRAKRYEAGHRY